MKIAHFATDIICLTGAYEATFSLSRDGIDTKKIGYWWTIILSGGLTPPECYWCCGQAKPLNLPIINAQTLEQLAGHWSSSAPYTHTLDVPGGRGITQTTPDYPDTGLCAMVKHLQEILNSFLFLFKLREGERFDRIWSWLPLRVYSIQAIWGRTVVKLWLGGFVGKVSILKTKENLGNVGWKKHGDF